MSPFLCTCNILGTVSLPTLIPQPLGRSPPCLPPVPHPRREKANRSPRLSCPGGDRILIWISPPPRPPLSPAVWPGVRGVKTSVACPPLLPPLAGTSRAGFAGAVPVLCLHLSPLLTVRYILCGGEGGVGGGGAIINLSRLTPQCGCLSWPAGRTRCRICQREERGREGEGGGERRRGEGRKREKLEKGAERKGRKGPDIFIALPTSFLHPSFHSLPGGMAGSWKR